MAIIETRSISNNIQRSMQDINLNQDKNNTSKKQVKESDKQAVYSQDMIEEIESEEIIGYTSEKECDEASAILTMFRQRREWEKKSSINGETGFERVLEDEDITEKLNQFLRLMSIDVAINFDVLLKQLKHFFPDDSDLFVVLKELIRRKSISKKLKAKLEIVLEYVEQHSNKKLVKAGINTALKARLFATPMDVKPAIMRSCYRHFLECDLHELEIYRNWIIQFGYVKRLIILEFMENALLTDMIALDPSCSKNEFGNLLSRLKQLNLLYSTEEMLIQSAIKNNVLSSLNNDPKAWFEFIFAIILDPTSLDTNLYVLLGDQLRAMEHRERGMILQLVFNLCKQIPNELYESNEHRELLLERFLHLGDKTFKYQLIERNKENR